MNMLLTGKITVKRQSIGYKEGTKQPQTKSEEIYVSLPARISEYKLYTKIVQPDGTEVKLQKNDIIVDEYTGFTYTITNHPQWGGGIKHHWEASLEVLVNK